MAALLLAPRVTQLVRQGAPVHTRPRGAARRRSASPAADGGQARPHMSPQNETEQWFPRRTPAAEWGTATALNYPVAPATTEVFYENFLRVLANNPCPA
jgi:hypothetical protein